MSFIKNVATSLATRTLPNVARNIFPQESKKLADFDEKLKSAKEIFNESREKVLSTGSAFAGVGPVSKQLSRQLRSGKFGLEHDHVEKYMMKSLTGDDGSGSSVDGDDPLAALASLELPESEAGDTHNNVDIGGIDNSTSNTFNINGSVGSGLTKGDALINERLAVNNESSLLIGSKQVGLLSNMAASLHAVTEFQNNNTAAFYDSALQHFQAQSQLAVSLEEGLADVYEYFKGSLAERKAEQARKAGLTTDGSFSSVLDPARAMETLTTGAFDTLFGEMSPLRGMLDGFSKDPLGTVIGAALGAGIAKLFESQIDFVKDQFNALEYKVQGTLENWANEPNDPNNPMSGLRQKIGEMFKVDRRTDATVSVGRYSRERVDFDGQTRKAIIDVIPMYLSKILKAVSKSSDHEVYDWERGNFSSARKINKRTKEELIGIDKTSYIGGLGSELETLLGGNQNLSSSQRTMLQRKLVKASLSRNSHKFNIEDMDFGDDELNAAWQTQLTGMSGKKKNELKHVFRSNRFERMRKLEKYEADMQSTGRDAAAILSGQSLGIRDEHDGHTPFLQRTRADGTPDPNAPRRPSNPVDRATENVTKFSEKLARWFEATQSKVSSTLTTHVVNPLKKWMGASDGDLDNTTILGLIANGFNSKVLLPMKKMLVGDKKAANLTVWKSIQHNLKRNVLMPFKRMMLGDGTNIRKLSETSLVESVQVGLNRTVLKPFKEFLVGRERAEEMGFFKALYTRFDESAIIPLKKALIGKDTDTATAARTSLVTAMQNRFDESILTPMKHMLLGKETVDVATAKATSLLSAIGKRIDESILFPVKKLLVGGNENKAKGFNIFKAIGHRLDRSVFFPLKKVLLGGEERTGASIAKTSLFQALKTGFTERVIQPLNSMLFGEDKRKLGFFKNLGDTMSPFFNKLLFGQDKASKAGFVENLKTEGKKLWNNIWTGAKEKFFKPAVDTVKELFGPVFKEFGATVGAELKHFGKTLFGSFSKAVSGAMEGGIKAGAKNLFKNVFGDETVQILRDNVVKPLRDLSDKLTENMSKVFKFVLRLPLNFLKGITDTMKINRMNQGRGNYSEGEMARLRELQRTGKVFNFLNLGGDPAHDPIASMTGSESTAKKASLFNRVFGKNKGDSTLSPAQVAAGVNPAASSDITTEKAKHAQAKVSAKAETKKEVLVTSSPAQKQARAASSALDGTSGASKETSKLLTQLVQQERILEETNLENAKARSAEAREKALTRKSDEIRNKQAATGLRGATQELANSAIVKLNEKFDFLTPALTKASTEVGSLLDFAKKNLTRLDARLENVVKLLRKRYGANVKGVKGSESVSMWANPFDWIGQKISGALRFGSNLLGGIFSSVGKTMTAIVQIPGKIAGSVRDLASSLINASAKVLSGAVSILGDAVKGLGSALTGILDGLGRALAGLGKAIGGAIEGIGNFVANVAGPLGKALGEVTGSLVTGFAPIVDTAMKGLSSLAKGALTATTELTKFAWSAVTSLMKLTGGLMSGLTSSITGNGFSFGGGGKFTLTNIADIYSHSRLDPLHVYVVDGKIATYPYKKRVAIRQTTFTDKAESRSLLGGVLSDKKEGAKDEKKGILGGLLGGLLGGKVASFATGIFTKIFGRLGNLIQVIVAATVALKSKVLSSRAGAAADALSGADGKGKGKKSWKDRIKGVFSRGAAAEGASTATGAATGRAGGGIVSRTLGRFGAKQAAGAAASQGASSAAAAGGGAAAKSIGMRALGFAGNVVKGLGVGAAIGVGGNMLADGLFEKGSTAHAMTASGSTGAGIGATVGSFIPVVGTAVGAIVGGLLGVLYEAVPRAINWFEKKFEKQIRNVTEYLIEIPNRIVAFTETLPTRITEFTQMLPDMLIGWMDSIPRKIANMFTPNTEVQKDGTVTEEKPSILGRLFVSLGQAMWTVVKAIPKVAVSIVEGIIKAGISVTVSAAFGVKKALTTGIGVIGDTLGRLLQEVALKARNMASIIPGATAAGIAISDEDYAKARKDLDAKYKQTALAREQALKNETDSASSTVATLTSWSVADKMSIGNSSINTNKAIYNEVLEQSKGDEKKARELFAKRTKMDAEAANKEFNLQRDERKHRDSQIKQGYGEGGWTENSGVDGSALTVVQHRGDPKTFTPQQVNDAITKAAHHAGIDPKVMERFAQIESAKKYWVTNKHGYMGLFQMGRSEFAKFSPEPNGNPLNPYHNAMAAANYMMYHAKHLKSRNIPATPEMLYMAHQQGLGGSSQIYRAAKGEGSVSAVIRRNMLNNPPQDGRGKTDNPAEFLSRWGAVFGSKGGVSGINDYEGSSDASGTLTEKSEEEKDREAAKQMVEQYLNGINGLSESKGFAALSKRNVGIGGASTEGYSNNPHATVATQKAEVLGKSAGVLAAEAANKRDGVDSPLSTPSAIGKSVGELAAEAANKRDGVPVRVTSSSTNTSEKQTRSEIAKAVEAQSKHSTSEPVDPVTAELKAQTAILIQIASNTGKVATNNFFSGTVPTTKSKKAVAETKALQAKVNKAQQDLAFSLDTFPSYLQPSAGALAVSKAGSNTT